jgi:hypothetical protein
MRRWRLLLPIFSLATLMAWLPALAVQMHRPQAEYSADETIQTDERTIQQKVFVTPTMERKELLTGAGDGAIQIFRYDSKVMWMVMPSQKMYMEHSMAGGPPKGNDNPAQWSYEDTAVGEETLNGMKVTKFKTIATSTDGKKYGGFSWRTKEGINIKQDLLYKEGNEKKRMLTELSNVKIATQDPKLFEIPEGFTKLDMGGMMGGMGRQGMGQPTGRPDMSGMPPPNTRQPATRPEVVTPQEPPTQEQEPPAESGVDKATNFMKGLFGR